MVVINAVYAIKQCADILIIYRWAFTTVSWLLILSVIIPRWPDNTPDGNSRMQIDYNDHCTVLLYVRFFFFLNFLFLPSTPATGRRPNG